MHHRLRSKKLITLCTYVKKQRLKYRLKMRPKFSEIYGSSNGKRKYGDWKN
jgi:hypothetical protein